MKTRGEKKLNETREKLLEGLKTGDEYKEYGKVFRPDSYFFKPENSYW